MLTLDQDEKFPTAQEFLERLQGDAELSSLSVDASIRQWLPVTTSELGTLVSLFYRAACCAWGCKGGDHQVERLASRVVNHSMSSYRLIRAGYYDESLVLIRGVGEITNLLWLFHKEPNELVAWKSTSRGDRLKFFGPSAVRKKIGNPPIDEDRYQRLCEVGAHPVPGFAPNHYEGNGRPHLGVEVQPIGVHVCIAELCLAVALCARPIGNLLGLEVERQKQIIAAASRLVRSLGACTIKNYGEFASEYNANMGRVLANLGGDAAAH